MTIATTSILLISGSTRGASTNTALLRTAQAIARLLRWPGLKTRPYENGVSPVYEKGVEATLALLR